MKTITKKFISQSIQEIILGSKISKAIFSLFLITAFWLPNSVVAANLTTSSTSSFTMPLCGFIYVSTDGDDTSGTGTSDYPYKTLNKAMSVAVSGSIIRMKSGTYNENLILAMKTGVTIEGGFERTGTSINNYIWTKTSAAASATTINFSGTETIDANTAHVMGIKAVSVTSWALQDLTITTATASGQTTSGNGKSNYAVYTNDCTDYKITRCNITSGNASAGLNGAAGNNGGAGGTGGFGGYGADTKNESPAGVGGVGGAGGNAGANGGVSGGYGGGGGSGANDYENINSYAGYPGESTSCASGGAGSVSNNSYTLNSGAAGGTCYSNGATGSDGSIGTALSSTFFVPGNGTNGIAGGAGSGGGGGGGGGRNQCAGNTASGNGGSGGGGGGGSGSGGIGGQGGGSTFGIYVYSSNGDLTGNTILSGTAGAAGIGGAGGAGGAGGSGNSSNTYQGGGQINYGGAGGNGSAGGAGGKGGDGSAGISAQVYTSGVGSTSPTASIPNPTTLTINYTRGNADNYIPGKSCINSETELTAASVASGNWVLPTGVTLVNDLNASTSSYTLSSTAIRITASTAGVKDLTVNGGLYKNYLNVASDARTLPVIVKSASVILVGATIDLSVTNSYDAGSILEYEWLVYASSPTDVLFSKTASSFTTPAFATVGNYNIRYRERHACCGWSTPVFSQLTVNPFPPTITSISATSGPITGGTSVVITGTNLTAATIKFGTTNVTNYTVNSDTEITAVSPAGINGKVNVTVTTAGGTTNSTNEFTYTPTIALTAGGLGSLLTTTQKANLTNLIITGTIDARDFKTMRDDMPLLAVLDISATAIIEYTGTDGTAAGASSTVYPANEIPQYAFYNPDTNTGKTSLNSFTFPTSTTSIGKGAFAFCTGFTGTLVIPSSITKIGDEAYNACSGFTGTLTIPKSIISIGVNSFYECISLTGISFESTSSLKTIGYHAFMNNTGLIGNLNIPASVTSIGFDGFANCSNLQSLTFESGSALKIIDVNAFYECNSLTGTLTIPSSVEEIRNSAFYKCNKLSSIVFENNSSLTLIGEYAFAWCSSITSISIPTLVTSIGQNAFQSCTSLSSINAYPTTPVDLSTSDNVFLSVNKTTCKLIVPADSYTSYTTADKWNDFLPNIQAVPSKPTSVTATEGDASATVSFTAPASNGSAITSYKVTSSTGGITATGSASPITVTGLTNGTAYTFTVTATNEIGIGSASDASNSITPLIPVITITNPSNAKIEGVSLASSYSSLANAIAAINSITTMTGPVIINMAAGTTETAPVDGYLLGNETLNALTTATKTITFQKSGTGANPLITAFTPEISSSTDGIWKILGTDYVTIDGIDLQENATNTSSTQLMEWGYAILKLNATDGTQNISISNCVISLSKTYSYGIYGGNHTAISTTALTISSATGTNANIKIKGCTISNCNIPIYINGCSNPTYYDSGLEIGTTTGNTILSSPNGIQINNQTAPKIENNSITAQGQGANVNVIYVTNTSGDIKINANTISITSVTWNNINLYGISVVGSGNKIDITNNTIQNCDFAARNGTFYGIYDSTSSTGNTTTITGNTISGNKYTCNSTGTFYGIFKEQNSNSPSVNISSNKIRNNTLIGSVYFYGLRTNSGNPLIVNNNEIYGNTKTNGTNTYNMYGVYAAGNSGDSKTISGNSIYTNSAAALVYGIYQSEGSPTITKNKIYDLNATLAASKVFGVYINNGPTVGVYNNLIADLKAPAGTLTAPAPSIAGIYINGGTTVNAYYNTVNLNATSTGTNFGTAAIWASTTPAVNLRNNILVNTSTANGTGKTVAYQRSYTTLTSYDASSNNNLLYAGTPSESNLIMYDGTNSYQTLTSYKEAMITRDAASVTENPTWVSTTGADATYLHINTTPGTQIESGGTPITDFTDDFDGNNRNESTPDIGADEFTGIRNVAPTDIALSATAINENVASNSAVGTLSSTDTDAGNTFTYTLVAGAGDTDNASFNISGSNLQITNSPDFEAKSSYSVRVRTTDQGGFLYTEKAFTITISNVNEIPTDIALSASAINENEAANSAVGTLSSTDPDATNTFTYTLVAGDGSTDNTSFNISGSNLQITNSPDFETKNSYKVRIRTTDQGDLTFEKEFTITINDVAEAPIATTNSTVTNISATGATLSGIINANNISTTVTFEYGLDNKYGKSVSASPSTVTETSNTAVSCVLTELTANTTYHYRLVGVNSAGTTLGEDMTFTTLDAMILTFNTDKGTGTTVTLPLRGTVNVVVDWGDGTKPEELNTNGNKDHSYVTGGIYKVTITGSLTQYGFGSSTGTNINKLVSVSSFGSLGITNLSGAFSGAINLTSVPASLPSGITDLSNMFYQASSFNQDISSWDVSKVTNMSYLFRNATNFNQSIGDWIVTKVTDMSYMFFYASNFNQYIGKWDVSNVTTMNSMFRQATNFDQNIGNWIVSKVTDMNYMFSSASNFDQNIGNWDVSKVTDMGCMFSYTSFNNNISNWIVSSVKMMYYMFDGNSKFNQDISFKPGTGAWNTSNVTDMRNMFHMASHFDQNIGNWDVSKVTKMGSMFSSATSFNQNLGAWRVENVTDMSDMFAGLKLSTANYNSLLTSWAALTLKPNVIFNGGTSKYNYGNPADAKLVLTGTNGWKITDGGMENELSVVTTQSVSDISTVTATGNGNITSLGVPNPTQYGVVWSTSTNPTVILTTKTSQGAIALTGAFTSSMTGLVANTTYYVKAYATNAAGTNYGTQVSFTTSPIAPTVTTQAVSSIATSTATGNGNITNLGVPNPTQYGVVWSTSTNPTVELTTKTSQGAIASTGAFMSSITGLAANTTYYVKAYATNSAGTNYGEEVSFTTITISGVPIDVSAIVGNTQATISFTAPLSNGGSAITCYTVTSSPGAKTGTGTTSPIIVTGLTNGTAYTFTVTATNAAGTSSASDASEAVIPNAAPTAIALSATAINENMAANSTVGALSSTDPDATNTFTYSLVTGDGSTDNGAFNISGGNLQITNSPNYEVKNSYSIRVKTIDQGGLSFEKVFTITINNVNESPTDIALSASAISENVVANSVVGALSSTDPDATNTFTYTLVAGDGSTDNTSFNISGSNLQITNSPDFETKNSYKVRIRTTDQGGLLYTEKAFTITINNVNETPTDIALSASAIDENVVANSVVGALSSTDPDATNTFTYTLVAGDGSTDNTSFNISGSNLQITNSPDFETKNSYKVRVRTTDQGNLWYEKTFTITINNVTEVPSIISIAATSRPTSATFNATINANTVSTTIAIKYGLTNTYGSTISTTPATVTGATNTDVTAEVTGLQLNTTYHYRVECVSADGTTTGEDQTFTTLPLDPTVTTQAVSSIATTTATGNGNITSLGVPNPTQYGVVWSTSTNPTVELTTKTSQGAIALTGAFTSSMTGLVANTTYYVKAYATNAAGTNYGTQVSFTTNAIDQIAPALGDGTTANPYQIATLNNLYWLSQNPTKWSSSYIQTANIDASASSGWDGGAGWTPIGNASTNFTGNYNGLCHTIDGLYINRPSTNYIGLFGYVHGNLKNLAVTNVLITGKDYVGGLVGYSWGQVEYSYSSGRVTGNNYVGGLVGESFTGSYGILSLNYCHSSCDVNGESSVGGLLGRSYVAKVNYCYSTGNVSGNGVSSYLSGGIGGLIGYNYDSYVNNSYSTSMVSGITNTGGFIGYNDSKFPVSNCFCRGDVTRLSGTSEYIGGFVGFDNNSASILQNCYSTSSIKGTSFTNKGFVGISSSGSYLNNFWDVDLSNQTTATGATAKTTAEMKTQSTFTNAGWDFISEITNGTNDYWGMDATNNDGFPFVTGKIEVTATASIMNPTYYSTLNEAFAAINLGSHQGAITIKVKSNTVETAIAKLYQSGYNSTSNYTSVNIYPTETGLSISGNIAAPLIDLYGADNVTLNGSIDGLDAGKGLVIVNNSTSNQPETSTIRLINDATGNTVKYCTIKGSSTNASAGVVLIGTATALTGTGNDNNTIAFNDISGTSFGSTYCGITSVGTSGKENSENIISHNNIFDCFRSSSSSYAINTANSSDFTIEGNVIYLTESLSPENSYNYKGIQIDGGNNYLIKDNFIGGSSADHTGSFIISSTFSHSFVGISINAGSTTASSIQNNTIGNIICITKSNTAFKGIHVVGGDVNVTGNTIGSASGKGSITSTSSGSSASSMGIYNVSSGIVTVDNNQIGSITTIGSETLPHSLYGIYTSTSTGKVTITKNTIGSKDPETTNSLYASSIASGSSQSVYGIGNLGEGTAVISENTISKLTNDTKSSSALSGKTSGIFVSSGANTIQNNTISDLTIANANNSNTMSAAVSGIVVYSSTAAAQTISGNTIYNLSNTYDSFAGSVIGLYFYGSTIASTVTKNYIYGLSVHAESTDANVYGIKIATGKTTYANNIINLGGNTKTKIYGIFETGSTSHNNNLYFNTVNISGSLASGATNPSYALYSAVNTNIRNFRNNIFSNTRSTVEGSNLHYAAYFAATSGTLTCDYNDYYAPGTGGVLGYYNFENKRALPIASGVGIDIHSINTDPLFANEGGTPAAYYLPAGSTLIGVAIADVATDYDGATRSTSMPAMGAIEYGVYTITSPTVANIKLTSATLGATIAPADAQLIDRGICWKTTPGVLSSDNKTSESGVKGGLFTVDVTGLTRSKTIYYRTYLTNARGTILSDNEASFSNVPIFTETGNWEDATKWNVGEIPGINTKSPEGNGANDDSPVINASCALSSSYKCTNLTINSGKTLTINAGSSLSVLGTLTNNAGADGLVIKSAVDETNGSLIYAKGSPSATVEMYSKAYWNLEAAALSRYNWQFFGIPVKTLAYNDAFSNSIVRKYNETATDNAALWEMQLAGSSLTSGTGYEIVQATGKTYSFKGELTNAAFIRTLPYTTNAKYPGQHIFGNPYTAAIDIKQIVFGDNTEASVYLYNTGTYNNWSATSTYSGTTTSAGQYTVSTIGTAGESEVPGQIPSMQGFLVKATASDGLITIPYSAIASNFSNSEMQRTPQKVAAAEKVITRIDVTSAHAADRMWIFTEPTSTRKFDNGWDGYKIMGSALNPQLFAMEKDGNYQIDAVPDINDTYLGFQAGVDTEFTLKFTQQNITSAYSKVYLMDLVEGDITDITADGSEYSFSAESTPTPIQRFKIVTSTGSITGKTGIADGKINVFYSNETLFIENFSDQKGTLILYDMKGIAVKAAKFDANKVTYISTQGLTPGAYLAKTGNGINQVTAKIIIR